MRRRKPISRKRAKPRSRKAPVCSVRGCNRRIAEEGLCSTHLTALLDKLFSLYIRRRDGRCMNCGSTYRLECSHHITRARHGTRWVASNASAHCSACHVKFTHHPQLHREWITDHIGEVALLELMDLAYGPRDENGVRGEPAKPDHAALLRWLQSEAA